MLTTLHLFSLFCILIFNLVQKVSSLNQSAYGNIPTDIYSQPTAPLIAVVSGVLAGILLTGILIFGIWMCSIRHRYPTPFKKIEHSPTWPKAELAGTCLSEMHGDSSDDPELEAGAGAQAELESQTWPPELGDRRSQCELWGDTGAKELPSGCSN